jgi:acyl carrier protein
MADEVKPIPELTEESLNEVNVEEAVKHALSLACDREPSQISLRDRITADLRCQSDDLIYSCVDLERATGIRFTIGDFRRCRTVRQFVEMVQRYVDVNKTYL